jgi:hypothetical protein
MRVKSVAACELSTPAVTINCGKSTCTSFGLMSVPLTDLANRDEGGVMKKGRAVVLCLLVALLGNLAFVGHTQAETRTLAQYASDFARDLYENKDIGTTHDLSQYVGSAEFGTYLSEKVTIRQLVTKRAFLDKRNYTIRAKLLTIEALDTDAFFVSLGLTVRFNYVGSENLDSGSGETLNLIVTSDNGGYKVADAYAPHDWFDERMRGRNVDLKQTYEERNGSSLPAISEILDAAKKYEDYLDSYYDGLDQLVLGYRSGPSETTPVAASIQSTINKAAIASYARSYCTYNPPPSGGSFVPYYDFSQIPGNWDCTNFVSHAILAGGGTPYNNGNPATGWYYVSLNNRSYSWSSVQYLYQYLTRSTSTPGPYGSSSTYSIFDERSGYPFVNGDILQHQGGDGVWWHSTVITGVYQAYPWSPYYLGALVCGRTDAQNHNLNDRAEDIYPGNPKRVIALSGNR